MEIKTQNSQTFWISVTTHNIFLIIPKLASFFWWNYTSIREIWAKNSKITFPGIPAYFSRVSRLEISREIPGRNTSLLRYVLNYCLFNNAVYCRVHTINTVISESKVSKFYSEIHVESNILIIPVPAYHIHGFHVIF